MVQPYMAADGNGPKEKIQTPYAESGVDGQSFIAGMNRLLNDSEATVISSCDLDLENSYYDTADLALYKAGIALRVRKTGSDIEATIKTRRMSQGGIHVHPEYNIPLVEKPEVPDLKIFPEHIFTGLDVEALQKAVFENMAQNCRRHIWLVSYRGTEIEISYDRVSYKTADEGRVSGQEVELELKKGSARALREFAEGLIESVYGAGLAVFRPESLSKMHRAAIYAGISRLDPPAVDDTGISGGAGHSSSEQTEKNLAGLMSVLSRSASILYLGDAGRTSECAEKTMGIIMLALRKVIDTGNDADFVYSGRYAPMQSLLAGFIRHNPELDVCEPSNESSERIFVKRAWALDRLLTGADFIRVLLEINFAGLEEKSV